MSMRIPLLVLGFVAVLIATPSSPCLGQRAEPIGVSLHATLATSNQFATRSILQRAESDGQSRIGTWIVVGALAGAVAGGVWAGVEMSHANSDDLMFANVALAYSVGAGAVIGGLAGAFAYVVSHSPSQDL